MRKKPLRYLIISTFVFAMAAFPASAESENTEDRQLARKILEKADQVRFPPESFQVDVSITTSTPGQDAEMRKYRVLSKGNENALVMATEPASERGQIILMKGRDLWIYLPDVSQPVRLSLSQRLTGQVANGDVARANFSGDYNATILRTDLLNDQKYWVMELTGVDKSVTYHKVLYWVQQSNFWPYRAEFYSLSDRLLKTARYENYQTILGKLRPTRLVMENALRKGEESVLEYSEMKLRDLPDKVFTKDYLKKLE
jgi:outer membrane lipoprotein-sorting protein